MNTCGNCKHGVELRDSLRHGYTCDKVILMLDDCIKWDYKEWEKIEVFISEEEMTL